MTAFEREVSRAYARGKHSYQMYKGCGKRLLKDVAWLKRKAQLLNVEVKRHDATSSGSFAAAAGGVTSANLTAINVGDLVTDRDGNSIKAVNHSLRLTSRYNSSATQSSVCRVILVKGMYSENAAPTLADILQDPTDVNSFKQLDQSKGYKVLADRRFIMDSEHKGKSMTINRKVRHHLRYNGSTGSTSHIFGMLWLFLITDEATNFPTFSYQSRLRYVDN